MAKTTQTEQQVESDQTSFDGISFTDLTLHALLDMFDFAAHSFESIGGPYFWNGIGIDFSSPMPKEEVLAHAKERKAKKIYLAHTHPLSNDDAFRFLNVKVDPREKVAFGYKPLPIGNKPSSGDVQFFSQVQKEFANESIEIIGVVFSASGIWEFGIKNNASFDADKFVKIYDEFYPVDTSSDFMKEWHARGEFPNYYMELQKPKMHTKSYKTQISKVKNPPAKQDDTEQEIAKAIEFFNANGIDLTFHSYLKFGIDPQSLMRRTLNRWTKQFTS